MIFSEITCTHAVKNLRNRIHFVEYDSYNAIITIMMFFSRIIFYSR
jgi:hypothetical protein